MPGALKGTVGAFQWDTTVLLSAMQPTGPDPSGIVLGTTVLVCGNMIGSKIVVNVQWNVQLSYVAFTDMERLIGDAAKNQATMNPTTAVFGSGETRGMIIKFAQRSFSSDDDEEVQAPHGPTVTENNMDSDVTFCVALKLSDIYFLFVYTTNVT